MENSIVRILVVDDFEPWRRVVCSSLEERPNFQIVGEAGDGLEAVWTAEDLIPDLIVLDIGLPNLSGIEVARRVLQSVPGTRVVFMSQERSSAIVEEALRTGAGGYVVKTDAARDLLQAVEAVLQGNQFVSATLIGDGRTQSEHKSSEMFRPQKAEHHKVEFYPDDAAFVDDFVLFIESALKIGNPVVVIATESHRARFMERLEAGGLDVAVAVEQKRYIPLDIAASLATFVVDDSRSNEVGHSIKQALADVVETYPHVAVG